MSLGIGSHAFSVVGSASGWGTGTYTHDSAIAVMAVHAGVVANSESAIIQVNRTGSLSSYTLYWINPKRDNHLQLRRVEW